MDALVYEDTPLASYFEGEAIPYDLSREQTPPHTPFAPQGLPNLKGRLRKIRRSASSIAPGSAYTEELLEKFRYVIVASQLLSDEAAPHSQSDHEGSGSGIHTTRGAVATVAVSFLAAWAIHWWTIRKRSTKVLTWTDIAPYASVVVLVVAVIAFCARRQYSNYLQRASTRTLSRYVDDSRSLDLTANNVVRFIQEVEVVARGYELGSPLPPISRLEDRRIVRRCNILRREIAHGLKVLIGLLAESHNSLQPYINELNVQRYHDIYEISMVEYEQAIEITKEPQTEDSGSLRELRFSLRLHALARKVFLCDLLALRETNGQSRFVQWNDVLRTLREIQHETSDKQISLSKTLTEEEWGNSKTDRKSLMGSGQTDGEGPKDNSTIRMQMRRFDEIGSGVRALNARAHLLREEINGLTNANSEDAVVASALSKHYEALGSEIRNLLFDWERGKAFMLPALETDHERASCSSSSVRTPISPSPTLGSLQIVDGGPADALRLLTGDSPSSADKGVFEEEVFEAVASRLPRKRMSVSVMTREEKIVKLAEERRKRATLQEQADNTTSMLRELQMVIKHRPKGSLPANSASNSSINGNRVASL